MKTPTSPWLAAAPALLLAACFVPPGFYARESFPPPAEPWQQQGRFKQDGEELPVAAPQQRPTQPKPAPQALVSSVENSEPAPTPAQEPPRPAAPVWDRGVVDAPAQGRVKPQEGPPRGLDPLSGRTHIIELYQQAVDERDALASKHEELRKALLEATTTLELERRESADLTARVAALESAQAELAGENEALAARLVQAQIRRLEAEKLLLETRLEQERTRAAEAARAAAGQPRARSAGE
ncbi:MAG TPA: hypothetical protein VF530_23525 [Planctomycetota bacterium]